MASAADTTDVIVLRGFRRIAAGALAVALTAVLVWFGTGLEPMWPLLWLAPLPVLIFAAGASRWAAALVAGLAWFLGMLTLWHYAHGVLHLPLPIVAELYCAEVVVFVAAVMLYRALVRRGAYIAAIIAFPAVRVAFEYLLSLVSPHGTAGSLAYTQLELLPLLQLASLTGPWGITFTTLLFPATLATSWQLRGNRRRAVRVAAVGLGAIAAVLVFGAVRLTGPGFTPVVKVGLVASDPPTSPDVAEDGAPTAALLDAYAHRATELAAKGARLIVLPEKLGVIIEAAAADLDTPLQALAEKLRATIVVGLIRVDKPVKYNEARIYTPGLPIHHYAKHHLLPPFESKLTPGNSLVTLPGPPGPLGVAICKDMDFTPLSRDYGDAGTAVLLVPAWDFVADRTAHGHMAIMRGVESGFAIVRAAKQGFLTVSDNRGRILAETASDTAPFATLLADVPVRHDTTLYLLFGDWFAWLTLLALAATLVRLARSRPAGS
jgi:apolipoprotein N-acyltransferase